MRRWYGNVREVGRGDTSSTVTVVLAHGYGANQGLWDNLLPALSRTNKVLLFDWDFTAASNKKAEDDDDGTCSSWYTFGRFADDLIALMDEREVRGGAVLVGHSMSAMVACIASVRRPQLFAHLVLLCASPRYINSSVEDGEDEGYVGGFERSAIDGMLDAMSSDFDGWVHAFVPNACGGDPDSVPHLERSFLAMHPGVALEVARMIFLGDQREVLDAVTAPCTVVQVKADFAAPPCVAEYMQRRMRKAVRVDVEVIDSVGHFPQLVAPQQLLDILRAVLSRHADAERGGGGGGVHHQINQAAEALLVEEEQEIKVARPMNEYDF